MDDSISRFWRKYTKKSSSYGISPPQVLHYIKHVKHLIQAAQGLRLKDHSADNITTYLSDLGRNPGINDHQFREHVSAIKLLFCDVVCLEWSTGYPWQLWLETRDLDITHSTIAREPTKSLYRTG